MSLLEAGIGSLLTRTSLRSLEQRGEARSAWARPSEETRAVRGPSRARPRAWHCARELRRPEP